MISVRNKNQDMRVLLMIHIIYYNPEDRVYEIQYEHCQS